MTEPLLSVRDLCVDYITDAGDVRACNNVSFDIAPGEVFGLAGESGCGKSTVAFSLMRYISHLRLLPVVRCCLTVRIF